MYKLNVTISGQSIIRTNEDGTKTSIPMSLDNSDYQKYLEWVAEGNTPEPADVPEGE
jgi:hypothetical protein